MNNISQLVKIGKNVKLGINNIIEDNVVISDNVIIGNNNKIFSNCILFPNVEVGDNNIIFEGSIIGENPVNMEDFIDKIYNGVKVGNNNFFHYNTVISGGTNGNKTLIGNNNKISRDVYISHDCIITNNVNIYPKVFICGFCKLFPYCGIGVNTSLRQFTILGSYSFIGMGTAVTKNIFPYCIYAGNKYLRINTKRVPENYHKYDNELIYLAENYKNMTDGQINQYFLFFPDEIKSDLSLFFNTIKGLQ
jgi:UDP-N-acetylglucosamine acyltransferase